MPSSSLPIVTPTKSPRISLPYTSTSVDPSAKLVHVFMSLPDDSPSREHTLRYIFSTIDNFVEDTGMPYQHCEVVYTSLRHMLHGKDDEESRLTVMQFIESHGL